MNATAARRRVADPNVPSGLATSAGGSPAGLRELFGNTNFVRLWLATGIQLTVNSALQFVLLIRVVELSGSSLAAVALVIVLAAPPVVFGLATGVLLDRLDKRRVLLVMVIIRSGLTAVLLVADNVSVGAIFAVAFLTATAGQFALPAGASLLPAFVKRSQLLAANSAFQFTATSTQLIGLVVLSPIMLKALGFDVSYILSAALLLATAPLLAKLPPLPPHPREQDGDAGASNGWWGQIRSAVGLGLADIHEAALRVWHDRLTAVALIQLITGVMLLFMFAVLVPRFVQDVLGRHPEDAVFVFWPTGIGALAVLVGLPRLARHFRVAVLASVGLAMITLVVVGFGALDLVRGSLSSDLLLGLTLLGALFLGFSYAMVNAPAQTLLHERTPPAMRGRLFSAQMMMANAVSMVALVIVGGVTDAAGIREALFLLGAAVFVITLLSVWLGRPGQSGAAPGLPAD